MKNCIEWKGRKSRKGYGVISINGNGVLAHRVAYKLFYGRLPAKLLVCHKCDNPPCINPEHLFLGTNTDNIRDAAKKGRMHRWNGLRRGEGNPKAKLTSIDVSNIRQLLSKGHGVCELARKYKVDNSTISDIKHNVSWRLD